MQETKPKIALVTGANSGIGLETARGLAAQSYRVILACRNIHKAEDARLDIVKSYPQADCEVLALDLASQMNIRSSLEVLRRKLSSLDVLINNAGVWTQERRLTKDGFEETFGVNHLGGFALTKGLLPLLLKAPSPRVVTLSSALHYQGKMDWEDLEFKQKPFSGFAAYNQSKLANVLMTRELMRRYGQEGLLAYAVHPGVVATSLGREFPAILMKLSQIFMTTPQKGARCSLLAATAPSGELPNGSYLERGKPKRPSSRALVAEDAERLWQISESLLG